jgi:hypothetical protein
LLPISRGRRQMRWGRWRGSRAGGDGGDGAAGTYDVKSETKNIFFHCNTNIIA